MSQRGIDRVYTWFADFAAVNTLAAFGERVAVPLRR